jgi:hypothetical protein
MPTGFKGPLVGGTRSTQESYPYRAGMGLVPAAEFNVLFDDFVLPFASNTTTGWTAIVDTGCTNVTNTTAATGANGVMSMTSDTTGEGSAIYGALSLQLTSGKKAFVECRVQLNEVTDNIFQFGLSALTATTNPEDLWTTVAADVISFGIADGAATTVLYTDKTNGGISTATGTRSLTAATWHTLGIYFDGTTAFAYVDGKQSASTTTRVPTGVALAPFIGHLNGDGSGTDTAFVDYIRVCVER